jgi:hypothetical protein
LKSYNLPNYLRYKEDLKDSIERQAEQESYADFTRDELIVRFLPLVENIARKFSTSDQASGVLDITDLIHSGSIGLIQAVDYNGFASTTSGANVNNVWSTGATSNSITVTTSGSYTVYFVDAEDEEAAVHRVMSHQKDVDEEDEIDEEVTNYEVKKARFKRFTIKAT